MARRGPALLPTAIAVGIPLGVFLATAAPSGYWLDAGTFVAQGRDFGIAHPPGHPLAGLVSTAASLLPLGPLSFRVALASALCAGLAAFFLHRSVFATLRSIGVARRLVTPLAVATTWWVSGAYGWWFQAVRPEVYALQAALAMFIIDRLIAFEQGWPDAPDPRPIYAASLAFGLALANHHLLAFLLLPAAAASLARAVRSSGFRALWRATLACALGAATYVYLPLRARAHPLSSLGDPSTLDNFWWVVSAEAFQKNQGAGVPDPLGFRLADVAIQLAESLHVGILLVALGGIYVLLRLTSARRIGAIWCTILAVFIAARAWLGFVRHNPDALGYLMPAMAALGVLAAAFLGAVLQMIPLRAARLSSAIALLLAVGSGWQFARAAPQASLAHERSGDLLDDALVRELPTRSVLVAHGPQTIFRIAGLRAEEGARPDITIVPVPLLTYPGMASDLLEEEPALRDLVRGALMTGELRQPDVQSLTMRRPLLVEMDPRVPLALYESLAPLGLYHAVLPGGATTADVREGGDAQRKEWGGVLTRASWGPGVDPEFEHQVLWRRTHDALFFAALGERDLARDALETALEASPTERILVGLRDALDTPNADGELSGAIDIRPFVIEAE